MPLNWAILSFPTLLSTKPPSYPLKPNQDPKFKHKNENTKWHKQAKQLCLKYYYPLLSVQWIKLTKRRRQIQSTGRGNLVSGSEFNRLDFFLTVFDQTVILPGHQITPLYMTSHVNCRGLIIKETWEGWPGDNVNLQSINYISLYNRYLHKFHYFFEIWA